MRFFAIAVLIQVTLFTSAYTQDAEALLQKANSLATFDHKYKEALVYLNQSLTIDSSLYQRYSFRSELRAKTGDVDGAIEDIDRCIKKCKCPTRKYHVASYYQLRAKLNLLNTDSAAAMNDLNTSIAINPKEWTTYYRRSEFFLKRAKLKEALSDLDKAAALNDNEATIFIARGKLRNQLGDVNGACTDFKKVFEWGFDEYESFIKEKCK